jgi:hypothetical protein
MNVALLALLSQVDVFFLRNNPWAVCFLSLKLSYPFKGLVGIALQHFIGCFFFLDLESYYVAPGWPGIQYIAQAGLKLAILLPQPPKC